MNLAIRVLLPYVSSWPWKSGVLTLCSYMIRQNINSNRPCIKECIIQMCAYLSFYFSPGTSCRYHDDVIKWKHFSRYWSFVRGSHRSPVNSPHKGQWRGAFMFSLICAWINRWVNNPVAGDLRRYRAHHDVIVMHLQIINTLVLFCYLPPPTTTPKQFDIY